jgi:hypothetical protein
VVEAEGNFSQVKMEKLSRYSAVHVELMLGVTPEAFDAVDVVTSFGGGACVITSLPFRHPLGNFDVARVE